MTILFSSTASYSLAAYNNYSAYRLKRLKGNNYTSIKNKKTANGYIKNEVTKITNANFANFWAINSSKKRISHKYKQGPGTGVSELIFTKKGYNVKNKQVGMGMENYNNKLHVAFVSGRVDFR